MVNSEQHKVFMTLMQAVIMTFMSFNNKKKRDISTNLNVVGILMYFSSSFCFLVKVVSVFVTLHICVLIISCPSDYTVSLSGYVCLKAKLF